MKLTLLTILLICPAVFVSSELAPNTFKGEVVDSHNELRAKQKVGQVEEDYELSLTAQKSADYPARIGRTEHSSSDAFGQSVADMTTTNTELDRIKSNVVDMKTGTSSCYRYMNSNILRKCNAAKICKVENTL